MFAVVNGRSGTKALDFETAFALDGGVANKIECEMAQDGEVVGGMIGTSAHLVIGKDDVHAPMEAGFNGPVLAHGVIELCGIWPQTGDVVAMFECRLAVQGALGSDHGEGLQVGPALRSMQTVELVEDITAALLQSAVVFIHVFVELVRCFLGAAWKAAKKSRSESAKIG